MKRSAPPTERELEQLAFENIAAKARRYELWHYVRTVRLTLTDRIFFRGSRALPKAVDDLVRSGLFQASPVSGPHEKIYEVFPMIGRKWSPLHTAREVNRPSLQVVWVVDPAHEELYGEMDIDLLSPEMALVGFFSRVHMAEVLVPGKTDHRRIRKALLKDPETRKYL